MRTVVRVNPATSSMPTESNFGAPKRITGLREKAKPSRGTPRKVSSFSLEFWS